LTDSIIVADTQYSLHLQQSTCGLLAEEEEAEEDSKGQFDHNGKLACCK